MSSKKAKFRLHMIFVLAGLVVLGMTVKSMMVKHSYAHETSTLVSPDQLITETYQAKLDRESDVAHLAKVGSNLLKINMPQYAAMNFKRASDLDKNYRDVAYGWAYALVQLDQANVINTGHINDVHTALDRVETIDPDYIPALKLKKLVAELETKTDIIQAIDARLALLEKK
jgi:hypothetical protein